MLEIVVLIFLTRDISSIAHTKGLKPVTWKIYTVIAWVISEVIGVFVGVILFGKDNLFSVFMIGIAFAITSYFILKAQLNKLPDYTDDDIDHIGNNQV